MYQVTLHFGDGRAPEELTAEKFGFEFGAWDESGSVWQQEEAADDGKAWLYINPSKMAAITKVPVTDPSESQDGPQKSQSESCSPIPDAESGTLPQPTTRARAQGSNLDNVGRERSEKRSQPGYAQSTVQDDYNGRVGRQWGFLDEQTRIHRRGVPRSSVLEHELLRFLSRFVCAKAEQLSSLWEVQKRLYEQELFSLAAERFFYSGERAEEQLAGMIHEDLIQSCSRYNHSGVLETAYQATQKGADLVELGSLPPIAPNDVAHGIAYYTKMVDLYQRVMNSMSGRAEWITGRELLSGEVMGAREKELGRSLPAGMLGAHRNWPMTPEGLLVFPESRTVAAVGLEITHVSDRRLDAYKIILDAYSTDPAVDRVCLFFAHEDAMQKVEELALRYRQDGFFTFARDDEAMQTSFAPEPDDSSH